MQTASPATSPSAPEPTRDPYHTNNATGLHGLRLHPPDLVVVHRVSAGAARGRRADRLCKLGRREVFAQAMVDLAVDLMSHYEYVATSLRRSAHLAAQRLEYLEYGTDHAELNDYPTATQRQQRRLSAGEGVKRTQSPPIRAA